MIRIKFEWQKEKYKIAVISILLAIACFFIYYFHIALKTDLVFTHFFYIPIILASLWWKRKGLVVAIFLSTLLILTHIFFEEHVACVNDYLRASMFIVIAFVVGTLTERSSKTERTLRETRDYLEKLLNYANAPIIVWDTAFRIIRFNQAFERLTGYTTDEVIGKKLHMLFPEASRDQSLRKIARTMSGEYWKLVEIPILQKDGDIRFVLWNSANIYADDGTTLLTTIAQGTDITKRKQVEEKRRKTVERFRKVIENIFQFVPEGLLVFTDKLNLFKNNKSFQDVVKKYSTKLNYTEQELAEIIIEEVKNRITNEDHTEIRISKKE